MKLDILIPIFIVIILSANSLPVNEGKADHGPLRPGTVSEVLVACPAANVKSTLKMFREVEELITPPIASEIAKKNSCLYGFGKAIVVEKIVCDYAVKRHKMTLTISKIQNRRLYTIFYVIPTDPSNPDCNDELLDNLKPIFNTHQQEESL